VDASIEHEPSGAPVIGGHPDAPPISIAHTAGLAGCAIAAPGCTAPGIDAEPVGAPAAEALRRLSAETGEASLAWADDHWPLRLWCAKEACVKAERAAADLLGRTLRVQHAGVLESDGSQRLVVRTHRDRVLAVVTAVDGGHVRAWTV
jgi:phosphopantetheinyl transferase